MAFNLQTLRTRALTSAVFVIVMMLGLLWNNWSFFILFSIVHFGCWYEFQKIIGLIDKDYMLISSFHKYGVMLAGWSIMFYFLDSSYNFNGEQLNVLKWWPLLGFIVLLPIVESLLSKKAILKNIGYSVLGLIYISLSWALMMDLRHDSNLVTNTIGRTADISRPWLIPVLTILSIWANDTMAYLVGSWIGRTPFSKISPKKTWEGTIGGALLCIVLVTLVFQQIFPWKYLLVISSIAAVIGTLGDLLESKLKRMANVKDSGNIMPGHGGFLDRFDSLIVATPVVWLYIKALLTL